METSSVLYNENLSIYEILSLLDKCGTGILAFVDENNKLIGVITDGDARRGILNQKKVLKDIINISPKTLDWSTPKNEIVAYMKSIHRRHLPLVDKNNNFNKIFSLDDIEFVSHDNWVVIMVGGLGSRLGELTRDIPKSMLKIGDKPILESIITNFMSFGFHNFYLAVNYKKEVIRDYFGDGSRMQIKIKYLEENEKLGTAGALSLIEYDLNEPLIITNGDVITSVDFEDLLSFHINKKSIATMCLMEYKHSIPYGVVEINDNEITSFEEKPEITFNVNTGIYVLDPTIVKHIPKETFYDMTSVFEKLLKEKSIPCFYKIKDYWIDVGHVKDYEKAKKDFEI